MTILKVVNKLRKPNASHVYVVWDGVKLFEITPEQLIYGMRNGTIACKELTLTADGSLISTALVPKKEPTLKDYIEDFYNSFKIRGFLKTRVYGSGKWSEKFARIALYRVKTGSVYYISFFTEGVYTIQKSKVGGVVFAVTPRKGLVQPNATFEQIPKDVKALVENCKSYISSMEADT